MYPSILSKEKNSLFVAHMVIGVFLCRHVLLIPKIFVWNS